jgi:ankyrin repeat protein
MEGHLAVVNELVSPNDINGTTSILGKRKSRGANIDAKDNDGDTPLHNACSRGHLAVVKALVNAGADILAANDRGKLPIDQAVSMRKSEVAKYLLQHIYATLGRPYLDPQSHDRPQLQLKDDLL